jgi:hypothetical protein
VRRTPGLLSVVAVSFALARAAGAADFRVNTYTTGAQAAPAVASDSTGRFAVAWASFKEDGDLDGVFAQTFEPDGSPAGPALRVNTYTTSSQSNPAVARDPAGRFLVVWQSVQPEDTSSGGIFARLFDETGSALTAELRVNTHTTQQQQNASVAAISGGFVVVWSSYGQDGSSHGIFGQRFDDTAAVLGAEFAVNTYTTFAQLFPAVAATGGGSGFVVTWETSGDGNLSGISARRFAASGAPDTDEFHVNITTTLQQRFPSVGADGGGGFLIAWESNQSGAYQVYAQRYAASGAPAGSEFRVSTYTTGGGSSVVGLAGGGFVVAWTGPGDGSFNGALAQRYSASGAPDGDPFALNAYTSSSQSGVALARGIGGGFVAVWDSPTQDGNVDGIFGRQVVFAPPTDVADLRVNTYTTMGQIGATVAVGPAGFVIVWTSVSSQDGQANGVFGQRFGPGGAPLGDEFRVNTTTTSNQQRPLVSLLANGEFVVVFEDQNGFDLMGRRFAATGEPLATEFRVNTYTTGSQGYASAAGNAGGFVVVWNSRLYAPAAGTEVRAQRFSAAAAPLGTEFAVNTYTTHSQGYGSVAVASTGEFVVAWQSSGQFAGYDVLAQRFDASGLPKGGDFLVNTTTTGNQFLAKTALHASGDFVVVWASSPSGGSYDVFGQRFAPSGQALGTEFRVNTFPTGIVGHYVDEQIASVAADREGFVVVWNSPANQGIFGRRFGTDGSPIGPEFRVNVSTAPPMLTRSVAADADGSFVVAYTLAVGSPVSLDVFRRRFSGVVPGDVDGSGVVDIADVFYLINFLFASGPLPSGPADADGNGVVDIADVFYLINFLFAGGPAPV